MHLFKAVPYARQYPMPCTCICGDVATNLAAALGALVQGHSKALLSNVLVQHIQHAPRVARHNAAHLYAVQPPMRLPTGTQPPLPGTRLSSLQHTDLNFPSMATLLE